MKPWLWMGLSALVFFPAALSAQFAFYDSLNGIHWSQIQPPSYENFTQCQIVREGLGYVLSATGTLYEFDATQTPPWRRLPRPEPYAVKHFFALQKNNVWVTVNVPPLYKQTLFHWNGFAWSPMASPNVYNIRNFLLASPEEGWFACEYGELWHYARGQWQQEKLPLFLHLEELSLTADSVLYIACEAPDQAALLRRWRGQWQLFDLRSLVNRPLNILLSSSRYLLWLNPDYSYQRLQVFNQPVWLLPLRKAQMFANGFGYGFKDKRIFALHDTTYAQIAEAPIEITDFSLWNERFSWFVGWYGLILAPADKPLVRQQPQDRFFNLREYNISDVYGMAVLQKRPGDISRLYFIQTGAQNSVYDTQNFRNRLQLSDQAARLNLAGSLVYDDLSHTDGGKRTNYDQAVAVGDLNGDGREDIVITNMYGYPSVYFDSGHNYYHDATAYSGLKKWSDIRQRPMLANLFDADHDSDLDLFIACQFQSNAFFVNNGRGQFTEVTDAAGLSTEGGGIGGYVADFDNDGWEDLYVTRVNRPNLMYRNLGPEARTGLPRFVDVSAVSGDACWPALKPSQGAAIADYDNDGDFDLLVCNLSNGVRLLQNNGSGFFKNVTAAAGLASKDQSAGAVFFDADHDGDLDLIVANRGFERFYKNQGDGRFIELSEYLGQNEVFDDATRNNSLQFGGSSTGTLTVDYDGDEDLDVLVGNYDVGVFAFKNGLNRPNSAIEIFPAGIVSNRSAIGAKVFLCEANKMHDPAGLLGLQMIESANSYGCSPVKAAHFGVDPEKAYDVKIIFPSGLTREILGVRGGERRVVSEMDDLTASAIKARRALADLFLGYRSRERGLALILAAVLLATLLVVSKKFLGLSRDDQKRLAAIFALVFLFCLSLWFTPSLRWFVARPLLLSFVVTLLAIIFLRGKRLYQGRAASIDMLHIRLNAFGHGTLIHQLMNRVDLYAENLEAGEALPAAGRAKLAEHVAGLLHFLANEIRAILAYQYGNNFAMDLALRLETLWAKLKKALTQLRGRLATGEKLDQATLAEIGALQRQLRALVPEIQRRLDAAYHADVAGVIADFIRQRDHTGVQLREATKLPPARISAADLTYVLDELVQNALCQLDGRPPHIDIALRHYLDEIQIDVIDNGAGILENLWEEIFQSGFTTKPEGKGGFGLFHSRQRLEKCSGKLFVAASAMGCGTTMRICLKAATP